MSAPANVLLDMLGSLLLTPVRQHRSGERTPASGKPRVATCGNYGKDLSKIPDTAVVPRQGFFGPFDTYFPHRPPRGVPDARRFVDALACGPKHWAVRQDH